MGCIKDSCGDCAVWGRMIIIVCGIVAIAMTAISATSCEFVDFDHGIELPGEDGNMTNMTNSTDDFLADFVTNEFGIYDGSAGLFRAEINLESCRNWDDEEKREFDVQMQIARWGTIAGLACGFIGLIVVWMEFSCCRIKCGRCIECGFYLIAAIGVGLGALIYSSNVCDNPGGSYPCSYGKGTSYAVAAFALYIFCGMLLCVTPKPEPSCVRLQKNEETDPCCPCFKKPEKEEGEEDKDKESDQKQPPEEKEKKSMFAVFMCWKKKDNDDKDQEDAEENGAAAGSVNSDYHESVAEPEEIPQAVLVSDAPVDVQRSYSQRYLDPLPEEEPEPEKAELAGWPSFWPRKEPKVEESPEESSPDLFFDAAASERDDGGKGNLTAEVF